MTAHAKHVWRADPKVPRLTVNQTGHMERARKLDECERHLPYNLDVAFLDALCRL